MIELHPVTTETAMLSVSTQREQLGTVETLDWKCEPFIMHGQTSLVCPRCHLYGTSVHSLSLPIHQREANDLPTLVTQMSVVIHALVACTVLSPCGEVFIYTVLLSSGLN